MCCDRLGALGGTDMVVCATCTPDASFGDRMIAFGIIVSVVDAATIVAPFCVAAIVSVG